MAFMLCALVTGCQRDPPERTGPLSLYCYLEGDGQPLIVSFASYGDTAIVDDRGAKVRLQRVTPQALETDRYEAGGYILSFDPEARLARPDGSARGPCQ